MAHDPARYLSRQLNRAIAAAATPAPVPRVSGKGRELIPLMRAAVSQGWKVIHLDGGHLRWIPPDRSRPAIVTSATPSDHRAIRNIRSDLRRSGLVV